MYMYVLMNVYVAFFVEYDEGTCVYVSVLLFVDIHRCVTRSNRSFRNTRRLR